MRVSLYPTGSLLISCVFFLVSCGTNSSTPDTALWTYQIPAESIMNKAVDCIVISNDGTMIAAGARTNEIYILDAETGNLKKTLHGHKSWIYAANFSSDGKFLVSGDMHGEIVRWNLESGVEAQVISIYPIQVSDIIPLGDKGETVLAACGDGTVKQFDLIKNKVMKNFTLHNQSVNCIALSADQKLLLSGSIDRIAHLCELETGKIRFSMTGHEGPLTCVGFLREESQMLTGCVDKTVRIWDTESGKKIKSIERAESEVQKSQRTFQCNKFVTSDKDNTYIWDAQSGSIVQQIKNLSGVYTAAISPQGDYTVRADMLGNIQRWNLKK